MQESSGHQQEDILGDGDISPVKESVGIGPSDTIVNDRPSVQEHFVPQIQKRTPFYMQDMENNFNPIQTMPQSAGKSIAEFEVLDQEPNQVIFQNKKASVRSPNYEPSQIHSPQYAEGKNDLPELEQGNIISVHRIDGQGQVPQDEDQFFKIVSSDSQLMNHLNLPPLQEMVFSLDNRAQNQMQTFQYYQQVKKMQQKLDQEGREYRNDLIDTLQKSQLNLDQALNMATQGNESLMNAKPLQMIGKAQQPQPRNYNKDSALRESKSYAHILAMMKNIEEYGKNLEYQQNLTLQEHLQTAHGIGPQLKTSNQNQNQLNIPLNLRPTGASRSSSSIVQMLGNNQLEGSKNGSQELLLQQIDTEFLNAPYKKSIGDKVEHSGRNTTCLYDIDIGRYNQMMRTEIERDYNLLKPEDNLLENSQTTREAWPGLQAQRDQLNSFRKTHSTIGVHFKSKSQPSGGHYKHCIGCQSLLMRQQIQYIQQQKKYIENLKKLNQMSNTLKQQLNDGFQSGSPKLNTDLKTVVSDLNKARQHVSAMLSQRKNNISPPFARNLIMKPNNQLGIKAQKYKIVGGKVYEAVQLTEHQFSGGSKVYEPEAKIPSQEVIKTHADAGAQPSKSFNNTFDRHSANILDNTLNKTANLEQMTKVDNFNIGCDVKIHNQVEEDNLDTISIKRGTIKSHEPRTKLNLGKMDLSDQIGMIPTSAIQSNNIASLQSPQVIMSNDGMGFTNGVQQPVVNIQQPKKMTIENEVGQAMTSAQNFKKRPLTSKASRMGSQNFTRNLQNAKDPSNTQFDTAGTIQSHYRNSKKSHPYQPNINSIRSGSTKKPPNQKQFLKKHMSNNRYNQTQDMKTIFNKNATEVGSQTKLPSGVGLKVQTGFHQTQNGFQAPAKMSKDQLMLLESTLLLSGGIPAQALAKMSLDSQNIMLLKKKGVKSSKQSSRQPLQLGIAGRSTGTTLNLKEDGLKSRRAKLKDAKKISLKVNEGVPCSPSLGATMGPQYQATESNLQQLQGATYDQNAIYEEMTTALLPKQSSTIKQGSIRAQEPILHEVELISADDLLTANPSQITGAQLQNVNTSDHMQESSLRKQSNLVQTISGAQEVAYTQNVTKEQLLSENDAI